MSALSTQASQRQLAWRQKKIAAMGGVGGSDGATGTATVAEDLDLCLGYGVQIEALQTVTVVVQELYNLLGPDSVRRIFAIWQYTEQIIPVFVSAWSSNSVNDDSAHYPFMTVRVTVLP